MDKNRGWKDGQRLQAVEKNGRHEETRTPDLYRVKALLKGELKGHIERKQAPLLWCDQTFLN